MYYIERNEWNKKTAATAAYRLTAYYQRGCASRRRRRVLRGTIQLFLNLLTPRPERQRQ